MTPRFLSPELTLARRGFKPIGARQKGLDPA